MKNSNSSSRKATTSRWWIGGVLGSLVLMTLPITLIFWSYFVDGNDDAGTIMLLVTGILLFMAGGITVIVGQFAAAKMGRVMFESNAAENVQLLAAMQAAAGPQGSAQHQLKSGNAGDVFEQRNEIIEIDGGAFSSFQ